ncbi:tripartite tricarboxylate transporter substrate binding protein [Pigmentiphaga soli]|uniref:Bug family tripartite tricarboxylate transporter substrate binding protein n=1 Tax=Pigmentiphaga soli TaxID=1007095 RepID=UPI0031E63355
MPGGRGRQVFGAVAGAVLLAQLGAYAPSAAAAGEADTYPNRPIKIVIPFATGGVSDAIFRVLGKGLSDVLGQPVVVESRSGGGGTIGAAYVAAAVPDGYTLLQSNPTMISVAPRLVKGLTYDPVNAFTPIATVVTTPNILAVNKDLPIKTLADIPAYVKAHGDGQLSFASAGPGSTGHLSGQILQNAMHIEMTHVPYKSSGAAFPDVISGRVSMVFDSVPSTIGQVRSGQLRPVVVMSRTRSPVLPDVQTAIEAGYPAATLDFWMGLEGPAGIPPAIVEKLNAAVKKAMMTEEMKKQLATVGAEPFFSTPQEFADLRRRDAERLGKLVQEMKLTAD